MSPRHALPGALTVLAVLVSGAADPAAWSVSLLVLTGSRGETEICPCPGLEFGGPALRGGLHTTARTWAVPTLLLDGGDFLPAGTDSASSARADLAVETLQLLRLDVVGVGEADLALGRERLAAAARTLPLVCANLEGAGGIPPYRWLTAGNRKIAVVGYLDPSWVGTPPDSLRVTDPLAAVGKALQAVRGDADLVVLLAHASYDQVVELLPRLEGGVDVAVAGHPSGESRVFERAGDVPVLAPRDLAREAVQLTLSRTPGGPLTDLRPRTWNLKEVARGDPRIEKLTRAFEERWETR